MTLKTTPWDTAEHLKTPELVAAYLNSILEDGDSAELARALDTADRARRMHGLAVDHPTTSVTALDLDPLLRRFSDLGLRLQVAAA